MRRLLIVSFLLMATAASAGDWWVQAFGAASWSLTTKGTYGLDIENGAISAENLKAPTAKPYTGGGLMIGSSSHGGSRMFGIVFDYLGGTKTTELAEKDAVLGPGTLETNSAALQISLFFAGRAPFLSSDSGSWQGFFGAGAGVLSPMGEVSIKYRDYVVDEDPQDFEDKQSLSGTMFLLDVFLMEEWHFSGKFGLAATLGFRGVPYKDNDIATGTMGGSYRNQYTGPYVRVGLRYDI